MKMRKLFAGVAAMATLLGGIAFGATTANAATVSDADLAKTQSITINGAVAGHTFTAVQLGYFSSATTNEDGTALAGVTVETSNYKSFNNFQKPDVNNFEQLLSDNLPQGWDATATGKSYVGNPAGYVATLSNDQETPLYAGALRDFVTSLAKSTDFQDGIKNAKIPTAGTYTADENGESGTISGLQPGLYIVLDTTSTDPATVSIPMLVATQVNGLSLKGSTQGEVNLKNQTPTFTKGVSLTETGTPADHVAASFGDTVYYTLTTEVPVTTGYDNFVFSIKDTLPTGIVYKADSAKVSVDGSEAVAPALTQDGQSLTFDLSNQIADQTKAGKKIVVTYAAELTSDAKVYEESIQNKNVAVLTYSKNPSSVGEAATAELTASAYVFTGKFIITKQDKAGNKLNGAQFQVFKGGWNDNADGKGNPAATAPETTPLKFVKVSAGVYKLADSDDTNTVDVIPAGTTEVQGLEGYFTVKETKTPSAEYSDALKPTFVIGLRSNWNTPKTAVVQATYKMNTADPFKLVQLNGDTFTVTNVKNITELPLTGAAGTALFVVVAALIAGAGVTVFAKSRSTKRALEA
ncbi:isopeptide-forming domain-containing fimbrial protein [Bifidobacterium imperatoris]|uniref:Fimbrial isopeptide formation D2 domain-containing protein n=1 Tax=Bifidobacterium imperatoris TaxID=2020965 RepID=A0A2N5ITI6_9BIFI|nr:isopeptide-forming domain-containing fimbrial protein [Bifidobacterium imperatoris]PLS25279.1 fimbrial isopeptide formation D2 domain-containing protein [Bifidobacterium imperatoris]QSY58157.1 isopeptide-forming domain-containing fimbrial protein [Bifidobacterium imperatoris]